MNAKQFVIITIIGLLNIFSAAGQSIEQGRQALNSKDYEKARDIFAKIIRSQPSSATVNALYGQALYEVNDLELAYKHLTVAAKRKVTNSYRYLGLTCYKLYKFEEAVANLELFLDNSKDDALIKECEIENDRAQRAAALLRGVDNMEVIDSLVVDKATFISSYKLSPEAGAIYNYNEFFVGSVPVASSVYETQRADKIIYGQKSTERGYDIFTQVKLLDKYGDAKALPEVVNTEYNENYPVMLSDGATVYYASDNPDKSLGGYDILVTRYSTSNDMYLSPENVGMPFNSMANDYLLVVDDANGVGWFASDRYQPEDKVCIYIFIPNAEKRVLESQSEADRVAFAKLESIKLTQKGGDYSAILSKVFDSNRAVEVVKPSFSFVIGDELVYHQLTDFTNAQAKSLFQKYQNFSSDLQKKSEELDGLRLNYSKATQAKRGDLKGKIESLEKHIEDTIAQLNDVEVQCRNTEVKSLRK